MLRALYSSATGMQSQQLNLDVIANNLANVNTTGFKRSKIEFQDLLYQKIRTAGADQAGGTRTPVGLEVGHGARAVATPKIFTNGELTETGEKMDLAIQGDGFFEVLLPDGTIAYTRDGGFKTADDGTVVTTDGYPVQGGFQPVPAGTVGVQVQDSGDVTYIGSDGNTAFRIQLVRFINPTGLDSMGRNLYRETPASGAPELGNPSENGFGGLRQGYLELSNVKVVEEMINLIMAQRAYEVNSRAVQAADEMMQMSNSLRR
jgi:flagellar basal-body rod protein FlgG